MFIKYVSVHGFHYSHPQLSVVYSITSGGSRGGPRARGPGPLLPKSCEASRSQTLARKSGYVRLRLAVLTAYIYM